jgi:hypothetical protein
VAPFAAFVGFMAIEKALPIAPGMLYPVRAALVASVILVFRSSCVGSREQSHN